MQILIDKMFYKIHYDKTFGSGLGSIYSEEIN